MTDRTPPQSIESEMAALGSVLVDASMLDVVAPIVIPSDFYAPVHEAIFAAFLALSESGKPVDKIAVAEYLRDRNQLEKCGGLPYLSGLMEVVPTAASAGYYAAIVAEKAALRRLIHAGTEIAGFGFDGEADVPEALDRAEKALRNALERGQSQGAGIWARDSVLRAYGDLEARFSGGKADGHLTPWKELNDLIGALYPGELCLWVGGGKVGKSGAVLCIADYVAGTYGPVVYFALEMGERAMTRRYLAMYSSVSAKRQRLGDIRAEEWERISDAMQQIASRPVIFVGKSCNRLAEMRREMRRVQTEVGQIAAMVIDGVNFIGDVDVNKRATKNDQLDKVYSSLLRLGDEFGCVIHAVQHVNREGQRGKPGMTNIRDGGNPEGHAHAIIAPYRPDPHSAIVSERQKGEFLILATREGDSGEIPMRFLGHRGLWLDESSGLAWFERSKMAGVA